MANLTALVVALALGEMQLLDEMPLHDVLPLQQEIVRRGDAPIAAALMPIGSVRRRPSPSPTALVGSVVRRTTSVLSAQSPSLSRPLRTRTWDL